MLLAACETPLTHSIYGGKAPGLQVSDQQSVVVMGALIRNRGNYEMWFTSPRPIPVEGGWIQYDPVSRARIGTNMLYFTHSCNAGAPDCSATRYYAFQAPPGSYAFAWVIKSKDGSGAPYASGLTCFVQFKKCAVQFLSNGLSMVPAFSMEATVPSNALTFTVEPNEVIYVGDMTFDFDKDSKVKISTAISESAARNFISTYSFANRLVVKPFRVGATR